MFRRVALSLLFSAAALTVTAAPPQPQEKLQKGDFLAVCGDSITEQKLYCRFIEEYLLMCQPENLRIMQLGWNGETSWGFLTKMPTEAMRFHPSAVTICFGMNDGGYAEVVPNYDRYRRSLHGIIQNFKKDGVRFIVLGSPGVVDTQTFWAGEERAQKYNPILSKLKDVAREVAAEEGVTFADIHDAMADVMVKAKAKYGKAYPLAGQADGVHPDENGHLVMAHVFLKALGCESSKYPFCFYGEPSSPHSPKGILEFLPFNQELNRFTLVAKSASAASRVRVTWGDVSKEFAGADLERGINLAAEFYDNPFSAQFLKVEEAVKMQQDYETPLVKELMHKMNLLEPLVPEEKGAFDAIEAAGMRKARLLFDAAAGRVTPVTHSIKVEVVK
jgi:lysophospholipase L1-like esterase